MSEKKKKNGLSGLVKDAGRREFLKKGAAFGALAAAGAAVLPGCGSSSDDSDKKCENLNKIVWDKVYDVVVVGGGTGITAALAAAVSGAKTLLVEKSEELGGSTKLSGGVIWIPNNPVMKEENIPDSREGAIKYLTLLAQDQSDASIIEAFVDKGAEMVDFVTAHTSLTWRVSKMLGDYHPEWEGGVLNGRSIEPDLPGFLEFGPDLIDGLANGFTGAGGEIMLNAPAVSLITKLLDTGVQEILGLKVKSGGAVINVKANKGVILTAGGFDWEFEMKRHFLRGPSKYTLGHQGNTGDGVKMAMAVGVGLRNMNEVWGATVFKEDAEALMNAGSRPGLNAMIQRRMPGCITVNRYGKRFANEASDYDSAWRTFFAWENFGEVKCRNVPAYQISDSSLKPTASTGVKQAATIRELAEALGVDPDGLEATVTAFNDNVKNTGKDPEFHRGDSAYELEYGQTLGALEKSPFYGVEVAPADLGTCGGVMVNANAQALNPYGVVVPRLYAAGNNAGVGGPGAGYGGGGGTIGPAMVFAYLAGMHAAKLEPQTDE